MANSNTERKISYVSYEEYRKIFGDSDEENDSDMHFEGFSDVGSGDEESVSEDESNKEKTKQQ